MQYVDPSVSGHIYQVLLALLALGAVFWHQIGTVAARLWRRVRSWLGLRTPE